MVARVKTGVTESGRIARGARRVDRVVRERASRVGAAGGTFLLATQASVDPLYTGLLIGTAGLLLAGVGLWWDSRRFASSEVRTDVAPEPMAALERLPRVIPITDRYHGPSLVAASDLPECYRLVAPEKRYETLRQDLGEIFGTAWPKWEPWLLPTHETDESRQHVQRLRDYTMTSMRLRALDATTEPVSLPIVHTTAWRYLVQVSFASSAPAQQALDDLYDGITPRILHVKPYAARSRREHLLIWFDQWIIPHLYPDELRVRCVQQGGSNFRGTQRFAHSTWKFEDAVVSADSHNAGVTTLGELRQRGFFELPRFETGTISYLTPYDSSVDRD